MSSVEDKPMGKTMRFFVFCSAADRFLLMRCPLAERHRYASIGATVFFVGLLAALLGGYAIYTAFGSTWIAILLGAFWGALFFNIVRLFVSAAKKGDRKLSQILRIILPILLAIFFGIVVSKPLELKIFEQEVNEQLHLGGLEKLERLNSLYEKKIDIKKSRIEELEEKDDQRYQIREKYYEEYKCECEGSCLNGARGVGSACLRKEKKYHEADQEYQDMKGKNEKIISQIEQEINSLKQEKEISVSQLKVTFSSGLLARLEALNKLPVGPSVAIELLLIFVMVCPLFAKLISAPGSYDRLLTSTEHDYEKNIV
jgi:Domain of unknown function (DUF4407)